MFSLAFIIFHRYHGENCISGVGVGVGVGSGGSVGSGGVHFVYPRYKTYKNGTLLHSKGVPTPTPTHRP
jgi:hypothetical protein